MCREAVGRDPGDRKKLEIVLECMEIDDPRSPPEYIKNMLTWNMEELMQYRDRRSMERKILPPTIFRPHP
jgi:hypothetical protein